MILPIPSQSFAQPVMGLECKAQEDVLTAREQGLFQIKEKRRQRSDKGQKREVKPTPELIAIAKGNLAAARDRLNAARKKGSNEEFAAKLLEYADRLGKWERMTR